MLRVAVLAAAAAVLLAAACGGSAPEPRVALLTAVDAAPARVSFAFRSRPRDVQARWVGRDGLVEDGSGRRVRVAGSAFLVLRFEPASGFDLDADEGRLVYRGPRRIAVGGDGPVREVVRLGDFEVVLTWAVGLDERRGYALERDGGDVTVRFRSS